MFKCFSSKYLSGVKLIQSNSNARVLRIPFLISTIVFVVLIGVLMMYPIYQRPVDAGQLLINGIPLIAGMLTHITAHMISKGRARRMLDVYDLLVIAPMVLVLTNIFEKWEEGPYGRLGVAEFYIFLHGRDFLYTSGFGALFFLLSAPAIVSVLRWLYGQSRKIQDFFWLLIGKEKRPKFGLVFLEERKTRFIALTAVLAVILWIITVLMRIPTYVIVGRPGEAFLFQEYVISIAPLLVGYVLLLEVLYKSKGPKISNFFFKMIFSSTVTFGIFLAFVGRLEPVRFTALPIGQVLVTALLISFVENNAASLWTKWKIKRKKIAWFFFILALRTYGAFFPLFPTELWTDFLVIDSIIGSAIGAWVSSFFVYPKLTKKGSYLNAALFGSILSGTTAVILSIRFSNAASVTGVLDLHSMFVWLAGFGIIIVGVLVFHRTPYISPAIVGVGLALTNVLWPPWYAIFPLLMISISCHPFDRSRACLTHDKLAPWDK